MDKTRLYLLSSKIKQLLNNRLTAEAEKMLIQEKLSQDETAFLEECLCSYSYDISTDSFSITHGDNSEFLNLVAIVIKAVKKREE